MIDRRCIRFGQYGIQTSYFYTPKVQQNRLIAINRTALYYHNHFLPSRVSDQGIKQKHVMDWFYEKFTSPDQEPFIAVAREIGDQYTFELLMGGWPKHRIPSKTRRRKIARLIESIVEEA